MRMVDSDDVERPSVELVLHSQHILWVQLVTVHGAFRIEVPTTPGGLCNPHLAVSSTDDQAAAFVRIGFFHVRVNFIKYGLRNPEHQLSQSLPCNVSEVPPFHSTNRAAISSSGTSFFGGANVTHNKFRVNSLFPTHCYSMDRDGEKGNSPVWPHTYRAVKPAKLDHYRPQTASTEKAVRSIHLALMKDFFSPDGLLSQKLEDYEPRPSQERMAEIVTQALEGKTHAIIEAGTGTGKTLAYLAPALLHGRRLMVSTGTKTLQDQIFYKDIPLLERILDRPIRAAYLKGRNNYLCKLKLHTFQEEGLFTPLELDNFSEIVEWSKQTETGDRAELRSISDNDELWPRLDARRDRCLGTRCEEFDTCFLTLVRRKAMESDIVVVNHHLFFADLAIRESEMAQILPDYTAVIFDEAHDLEDIAAGYFGFHISNYRVQELLLDSRSLAQETEAQIEGPATALGRASDHFFGRFLLLKDGRHPLPELEGIDDLVNELHDLRRVFKKQLDRVSEWEHLARRSGEIASELEIFKNGNPDNYVSWLDRRGRGVFLEACPIDVSPLLQESLFDRVPTCILTSATLTVGGSTDYVQSRLGLENAQGETLSTEFDFKKQAALYIPTHLPDYRNPGYLPKAAEEIRNILAVSEGRAFVLFTSYHQMQACYKILADELPYPTLLQGRTSRSRLLEDFRRKRNAVLFATSSFWQGIDVKGDALSCVIIDKLPFQVPSDPLVQARIRQIEQEGGNAFSDYQVPAAILRLKQGFGRLIRSRTDRGILAILDSRLRTRGYGKLFLASLPDYAIVNRVDELKGFLDDEESARLSRAHQ